MRSTNSRVRPAERPAGSIARGRRERARKKGASDVNPMLLCPSVPSPGTRQLANYGSTVKATQAALVVTGVLPLAPALKRMTPSSLEQKLRTPDWFQVSGEAPAVYEVLIPP